MMGDETCGKDGIGNAPRTSGEVTEPLGAPPESTEYHKSLDGIFRFLASATQETLIIVMGTGFGFVYVVLGRVGLVFIGVIIGVLIHANWESGSAGQGAYAGQEDVHTIVSRLLDLQNSKSHTGVQKEDVNQFVDCFQFYKPQTRLALNELVEAVVRDYVRWWYHSILPNESSFPAASRRTLSRFLGTISQHVSSKRPADSLLDFMTNCSSILIVFLNEIAHALSQNSTLHVTDALHAYLNDNPNSNLANVLNREQQQHKLRVISEDILQNFLEKQTYDCEPARNFLKEVLASVILESTLKSCARPEWINGWIAYLLEDGEPDLSQVIDAGIGISDGASGPDGNISGDVGKVNLTGAQSSTHRSRETTSSQEVQHHLTNAGDEMRAAIQEAKRLSQLIAEADAENSRAKDEGLDRSMTRIELNNAPLVAVSVPSQHLLKMETSFSSHPSSNSPVVEANSSIATEKIPQPPKTELDDQRSQKAPGLLQNEISSMSGVPLIGTVEPRQQSPETSSRLPDMSFSSRPISTQKKVTVTGLYNATISIFDDSTATDTMRIRLKPAWEYLIQIEPAASNQPGWMIIRKYTDFEVLHEILRRIAQISGVTAFTQHHSSLPNWKNHSKNSLRMDLELYLRGALRYTQLAESEGMKRFLEKDHEQVGPKVSSGIGWPKQSALESVGKGVLEVLASAPKGVAEGGKVIGGGITGVFSNISNMGQKKQPQSANRSQESSKPSTSTMHQHDSTTDLDDGVASNHIESNSLSQDEVAAPETEVDNSFLYGHRDEGSAASVERPIGERSSASQSQDPSYTSSALPTSLFVDRPDPEVISPPHHPDTSDSCVARPGTAQFQANDKEIGDFGPVGLLNKEQSRESSNTQIDNDRIDPPQSSSPPNRTEPEPLSESETRIAVELLFAVINELYTLSSAWNIRRTILGAAKTYLLRPGNPALSSIQTLIQESIISSHTSDSGVASHLRKLRENVLPTEEELKSWPAELSSQEKDNLREKARQLLVRRGMPVALTGVMGNAATAEAMGKLFDCLQVEEFARGLIFALLLQGLRAITH